MGLRPNPSQRELEGKSDGEFWRKFSFLIKQLFGRKFPPSLFLNMFLSAWQAGNYYSHSVNMKEGICSLGRCKVERWNVGSPWCHCLAAPPTPRVGGYCPACRLVVSIWKRDCPYNYDTANRFFPLLAAENTLTVVGGRKAWQREADC